MIYKYLIITIILFLINGCQNNNINEALFPDRKVVEVRTILKESSGISEKEYIAYHKANNLPYSTARYEQNWKSKEYIYQVYKFDEAISYEELLTTLRNKYGDDRVVEKDLLSGVKYIKVYPSMDIVSLYLVVESYGVENHYSSLDSSGDSMLNVFYVTEMEKILKE